MQRHREEDHIGHKVKAKVDDGLEPAVTWAVLIRTEDDEDWWTKCASRDLMPAR